VLQKLLTNPTRTPPNKKEKDMQSVQELLKYINKDRARQIFDVMPKKSQKVVESVCKTYLFDVGFDLI